jgi:4-aminobutyrate aminotransferase / (S)-3-amino-2-methylpropionate transaminase / 5-aminovalerate transaminase
MANIQFSKNPIDVEKVNTKFREINTPIPAPGTLEILKSLDTYESRSMHGQLPLVWERAQNASIFDIAGNKWIDFTSGIFVTNVGHSNEKVSEAIQSAVCNEMFSCYAYPNAVRAQYLEKLIKFCGKPFDKAFLLSAGTEATEAAFKLMRMYGESKNKRSRGILTIENNWHGRTLGAQMMSSNDSQKTWVGPLDEHIHHLPFPYPWVVGSGDPIEFFKDSILNLKKRGIDPKTDLCGVMLETFQGWGAVFYPKEYVQEIERFCQQNDILLCFDEMQSGFGRTGKKFGFEHYCVNPDLIACGKGMGGGIPLSGVIGNKDVMDLPDVGNMSSTHSGNPLVCAAGLAVLNELEKVFPTIGKHMDTFASKLEDIASQFPNHVSAIHGKGMIFAVHFCNSDTGKPDGFIASKISELCMQKGLLVVHTGRETIKLGPPLTIELDALTEGLDVLRDCIEEAIND